MYKLFKFVTSQTLEAQIRGAERHGVLYRKVVAMLSHDTYGNDCPDIVVRMLFFLIDFTGLSGVAP